MGIAQKFEWLMSYNGSIKLIHPKQSRTNKDILRPSFISTIQFVDPLDTTTQLASIN